MLVMEAGRGLGLLAAVGRQCPAVTRDGDALVRGIGVNLSATAGRLKGNCGEATVSRGRPLVAGARVATPVVALARFAATAYQ